jgi:peptidoglycan/xylan/chitin deacetylase (PgdA/CDA1 family)
MQGLPSRLAKLQNGLYRTGRDIAWGLGRGESFLKSAKGARILVYHGVCKDDPLKFNTLFVRYKTFEEQLRLYKKYFNLISLDDFYEQRFSGNRFFLCLTFDDGFANNFNYVLPLLEQYQVPATFFITGIRDAGYDILWNDLFSLGRKFGPRELIFRNERFIKGSDGKYMSLQTGQRLVDLLRFTGFDEKKEILKQLDCCKKNADTDYWLQMDEEQIKALSASKWVTIGSHSYYHDDLAKIPAFDAEADMIRSKQFLERVTGKEVKAFAFPYGSYSSEVISSAKKAGFAQLLVTEFLSEKDQQYPWMRERLTINPFISSINQLYANIRGNYKN